MTPGTGSRLASPFRGAVAQITRHQKDRAAEQTADARPRAAAIVILAIKLHVDVARRRRGACGQYRKIASDDLPIGIRERVALRAQRSKRADRDVALSLGPRVVDRSRFARHDKPAAAVVQRPRRRL